VEIGRFASDSSNDALHELHWLTVFPRALPVGHTSPRGRLGALKGAQAATTCVLLQRWRCSYGLQRLLQVRAAAAFAYSQFASDGTLWSLQPRGCRASRT
jgi:hypothetical protein